ncbi:MULTISPECIES: hypothetical protein [unclassified Coleofasciculus]|uniref:hypothetical protein n=1 Tax=unclassified Coleofasciculus TaxID=2692782 RepID=UPI00187E0D70|nr:MULTISPECIES: hypothetical protein [unclassified Coleofasciculus]MBE9124981.1 hypothetical protein [Coleofasciculus sp. LEGE 07081]MBE9148005.1 hypothetical protein [Coleofasciculus sp. LEGE 07092]
MNVNGKTEPFLIQTADSHPAPETLPETNAQLLTEQLLEELHKASHWQRQTLAEAAKELQELLKRLEETNPTATEAQQKAFVTEAITPPCKERFLNALQAGWREAIAEFLDNSYLKVGIATLEAWKHAD